MRNWVVPRRLILCCFIPFGGFPPFFLFFFLFRRIHFKYTYNIIRRLGRAGKFLSSTTTAVVVSHKHWHSNETMREILIYRYTNCSSAKRRHDLTSPPRPHSLTLSFSLSAITYQEATAAAALLIVVPPLGVEDDTLKLIGCKKKSWGA